MLEWLERQMPHASVFSDNPLFRSEVRRIRWGQSIKQLENYIIIVSLIINLFIVSLWGIIVITRQTSSTVLNTTAEVIVYLLFLNIGLSIFFDLGCFVSGFKSYQREINTSYWDILRLTPLDEAEIIATERALIQVHTWRFMIILSALRLSIGIIILLYLLLSAASLIIAAWLVFVYFIIEPCWRMRTLTALGQGWSIVNRNHISPFLIATSIFLVFEAAQYGFTLFAANWMLYVNDELEVGITFLCLAPASLIAFGGLAALIHTQLEKWALRQIEIFVKLN